ncbi:MAG: hypothetical protein NWE87_00265 [Candidatus Bathyarchaeota archaeon]|nr:hypothetical protein [Candidatus Bathyarchaeota archaeon]
MYSRNELWMVWKRGTVVIQFSESTLNLVPNPPLTRKKGEV